MPAGESGRPTVTVVVATYRRARLLPRLIEALERQSLPAGSFDVVLVDDASPDDTPEVTRRLLGTTSLRLRVERQPRNGGPAAARNSGWRLATGEVVAFTDDDCVPAPGWLEAGLEAMARGAGVVSGRTVPDPAQRDQLGPFARTITAEDGRYVQTCNAFYRLRDVEQLGGFDEAMRTGEDTDLALRAQEAGRTVVYEPDALVHHDVRPPSLSATLRETLLWADLPLVVHRHPQVRDSYLHQRLWWKPSHPPVLLAAAGLALAASGRRGLSVAAALPWLHHRLVRAPLTASPRDRLTTLPGAFAVDLLEVAVMARGSWKHRTLVL